MRQHRRWHLRDVPLLSAGDLAALSSAHGAPWNGFSEGPCSPSYLPEPRRVRLRLRYPWCARDLPLPYDYCTSTMSTKQYHFCTIGTSNVQTSFLEVPCQRVEVRFGNVALGTEGGSQKRRLGLMMAQR